MTLSEQHFQNNRYDLLSRLAADISHEIKNPLHAMVINLELVRRKVEKGDAAQALERVAIVEDEIRKVHGLANALLEALRPPRDARTSCGFEAVFKEFAPLITARARCARVELELTGDPVGNIVGLPAHELRLLFLNLADRAVRVAGAGGSVALVVRPGEGGIELDVVCSKPPLDEGEQAWLNDAPAAVDGIDLGLRVVRDLVTRTGGRIATGRTEDQRHRLSLVLPNAVAA